jgi:hypothetical protein
MHTVNEISIGGRRQVLQDGNDVCDSESDSKNEEHGEELTGCYLGIPLDKDGNPLSAAYRLSSERAAALRWSASFTNEFSGSAIWASAADPGMSTTHSLPMREGKLTSLNSDDEEPMSEDQKRAQMITRSQAKHTRALSPLTF